MRTMYYATQINMYLLIEYSNTAISLRRHLIARRSSADMLILFWAHQLRFLIPPKLAQVQTYPVQNGNHEYVTSESRYRG